MILQLQLLCSLRLRLDEIQGILLGFLPDRADVIGEPDTETLVRDPQHLGPKGRADELCTSKSIITCFTVFIVTIRIGPVGQVE